MNFQIDLIDMRHRPDGSFKWINWSSYGPGTGLNVMCLLLHYQLNQVFTVLGTPKILYSDNGQELFNEIILKSGLGK